MTRKQKKILLRIVVSSLLLAAVTVLEKTVAGIPEAVLLAAYLVPYFAVGYDVLYSAVRKVISGRAFDESLLMTVATLGALTVGLFPNAEPEYREAVFVMIFYQTGELFQSIAVGKSRKSIAALMDIKPDKAVVLRDGKELELSPEEVARDEILLIRPGEKIPLDGTVCSGSSTVDTAALTGESVPRTVSVGSEVYGGCINIGSVINVRVTKTSDETTVSKILELVENSSERKAESENFISKFARYYTPSVVAAAVLVAFLPPLFADSYISALPVFIVRALTFLVISCPCALVISIPLSLFGGIGAASKKGVLVKGSNYLEALAGIETVVFDKTGTLTCGTFEVTKVHSEKMTERELLFLAAHAEYYSNHPIARSIIRAYGTVDASLVSDVAENAGHGVSAAVNGQKIELGNIGLMNSSGLYPEQPAVSGTVVFVAVNGEYAGYIVISDTVRPTSEKSIAELHKVGIKKTVMLTGDRSSTAEAVAKQVGIDEYFAELLPADKVYEIEKHMNRGEKTAFVGDGINDAPVIIRADVGIAMGALGSDAAIEAADIVLMDDDPMKIADAVRVSRKTPTIVRENVILALSVKAEVLLLSLIGFAPMWLAMFADVGVAVIAILNAMRTLKI